MIKYTAYHSSSCISGKTECELLLSRERIMPKDMLIHHLDDFIGNYILYCWILFLNFNTRHGICSLCSCYCVQNMWRYLPSGKVYLNIANRVNETATGIPLSTEKIKHCPIYWQQALLLNGVKNPIGIISFTYLEVCVKSNQYCNNDLILWAIYLAFLFTDVTKEILMKFLYCIFLALKFFMQFTTVYAVYHISL